MITGKPKSTIRLHIDLRLPCNGFAGGANLENDIASGNEERAQRVRHSLTGMTTVMRKFFLGLGLTLGLAVAAGPAATAAEFFVPQSHTYTPDNPRPPLFNTEQDRINARAAEIETRIFRDKLERRKRLERFEAFEDHQFGNHFQRSNTWD